MNLRIASTMPPDSDNYPLARRIRQRYIQAPGVIRWSDFSRAPARAAEFAAGRLPLLADVRRRWQPAIIGRDAARPSWVHARPASWPVSGDTARLPIVPARPIPPVSRTTAGPPSAAHVQTKAAGAGRPPTERLISTTADTVARKPSIRADLPPTPARPATQESRPSSPADRQLPADPVKAAKRRDQSGAMILQKKTPSPGTPNDGRLPNMANTAFPNGTRSARPTVIVDRKNRPPEGQQFSANRRRPAARSDRLVKAPRTSKMAPATPVSSTHDRFAERVTGPKSRGGAADPAPGPQSSQDPLRAAAPQKPAEIPSKPIIPLHRAASPPKAGKPTVQRQADPSRQGRRPSGGGHSRLPVARQAAAPAAGRPRDPAGRNAFGVSPIARPLDPVAIARPSGGQGAPVPPDRPRSPAGDAAPVTKPFIKGAKNAPVFASASGAAVARAAGSRPGRDLSVITAVPPAAEEAPVTRPTLPRRGNNFLVTQAAKQAANGLPVSRQAVQQPDSIGLRTQVINPSASAPHAAALNRQPPTAADRHDPAAGAAVTSAPGRDGRQPPDLAPRHPPTPQVMAAPPLLPKAAPGPWRFTREFSRRPYLQRDSKSRSAAALAAAARYPIGAVQPSAAWRPDTGRTPPTPAATRVFRAPAADRAAAPAAPPPEAGHGPATTAAESPAPAASAGSEALDLERLADEVYDIIERRLIVERERSGM